MMTGQRLLRIGVMLAALVTGVLGTGGAQTPVDSLRARYMLPRPTVRTASSWSGRGIPGITVQSPTGFSAEAGDVFFGVGFQQRTRYVHEVDGAVVAGFGIGDASRTIAIETAVTSYSTVRSGLGSHMSLNFNASRIVGDKMGISVGWENAVHSNGTDGQTSIYLAGTRLFSLRDYGAPFSEMSITAGVGTGRFRPEHRVQYDLNGIGEFGSVAVRIIRPVSAIADWSGQNLTLALSFAPFAHFPFVITPAMTDITHNSGDGRRFIAGAGISVNVGQLRALLGGNRDSQ